MRKTWPFLSLRVLPLVLVLQLAFGPTLLLAAGSVKPSDDPSVKAFQDKFEELNSELESGQDLNLTLEERDAFHLRGQRVEVTKDDGSIQTYDPSQLNLNMEPVPFTALEPSIDRDKRELTFVAYRYGKPVARHIISDVDAVSLTLDKEFLYLIDRRGSLSVMDMGYISRDIFKTMLPINEKLWEPKVATAIEDARLTQITIGAKPFSDDVIAELKSNGHVFPQDLSGNPMVKSGDLYVEAEIGGKWMPYGIFSRDVTYQFVLNAAEAYMKMILFVSPGALKTKYALRLLAEMNQSEKADALFKDAMTGMGPGVRQALLSVQSDQVTSLLKRTLGVDKTILDLEHKSELKGSASSPRDEFTVNQWRENWSKLRTNALSKREEILGRYRDDESQDDRYYQLDKLLDAGADRGDEALQEELDRHEGNYLVETKRIKGEDAEVISTLNKQIVSGDFSVSWKDLIAYEKPEKLTKIQKTLSDIRNAFTSEGVKQAGRVITLTGAALAVWGVYGFGQFVSQNDIHGIQNLTQFFGWFYQHSYPPVLKDVGYRVPLLLSETSMVAIIPTIMLSSWLTAGPGLRMTARLFDSLAAKLKAYAGTDRQFVNVLAERAQRLSANFDEKAKIWGDLKIWSVIITAGNRAYSKLMYPFWNWLFGSILQNPVFLESLREGINPLKKVTPESAIGQKAGLAESVRVGMVNPLPRWIDLTKEFFTGKSDAALAAKNEAQKNVLSLLALEKKRAIGLAWLLATLEVSERTDVDPSTLIMVAQGLVDSKDLEQLLRDPAKKNLWVRTRQEIYDTLARMQNTGIFEQDLAQVNPADLAACYRAAKEASLKVAAQGKIQKAVATLKANFVNFAQYAVRNVIAFGREDYAKLNSLFANDFVQKQVRQEFIFDHLMVVGYMSTFGERARLENPGDLAADRNGTFANLWTSQPMLNEVIQNTNAHLLSSGSNTVIVYQGTPQVTEEQYAPRESLIQPFADVEEGYLEGLFKWFVNMGFIPRKGMMASLMKSDVGGYSMKNYLKRFVLIQGSILMGVLPRVLIGGQNMENALRAFWLGTNAGFWIFAWPWIFLRSGNLMENQRFAKAVAPLEEARDQIIKGLDGRADSLSAGYDALLSLYKRGQKKKLRDAVIDTQNENTQSFSKADLEKMFGPDAVSFYGKAAELALALEEKDPGVRAGKIATARTDLLRIYNSVYGEKGMSDVEIARLNAASLLEYALKHPPVATKANPWVSETMTFTGGALLTTALYTVLSVQQYNPHRLENSNLVYWTVLNVVGLSTMYAVLGKEPLKYYSKVIDEKVLPWMKHAWSACQNLLGKIGHR